MALNLLKFPVQQATYDAYAPTHPDLFDAADTTLKLPVFPDEYVPISQPLGTTEAIRGIKSTTYPNPTVVRGMDVVVRDNSPIIGVVLNILRAEGTNNIITVNDYVLPDDGDTFTARQVRIPLPVIAATGMFSVSGNNWAVGGYQLRMEPI